MKRYVYLSIVLCLSVILVATLVYLIRSKEPLFALKNIKIKGMNQLSEGQVIKKIYPFLQESFFGTDVNKVKEMILSHPFVREVRVKRTFPFSLVIDVKEKVPSAIWVGPTGEVKVLDEEGVPYRGLMHDTKGLLVINAREAQDARSIFREIEAWTKQGFLHREWLSEVLYREGSMVLFSAQDAVEIVLGKEEQKERMKRALAVLEDARRRGVLIRAIDARFEKGAIIKEGKG